MKRGALVVAGIVALVGLSAGAAADERTDKAVKELDRQFAKVKSYTAKTEVMTDTEFGPGHTYKSEMVGTAEWLRKGEKARMRSETKCKTTETESGKTTTTPSTITTVDDGTFLWVLTEENGKKTVMKNQSPGVQMYRPKGFFQQFRTYFDIKLLKDDKVNGDDCYVFEMRMKPMEGAPPSGRQLVYFQKSHGILVKSEGFDANGKLISSSISTDIKVNADISAERFKFKIPEGAQVIDNTSPQAQPAQPESEPEKAEKKPDKKEEAEKPKKKKGIKLPKWPKRP